MVRGLLSWLTLGLLIPIDHPIKVAAYLNIAAAHLYPFMATLYSSSNGYLHDNALSRLKLVS